jgi:hypothetical protein
MEYESPTKTHSATLDTPPPSPPASARGGFSSMPTPSANSTGLGAMANSPQIMTMQGLAMAKDGLQLIANGVPELSQILSNTIQDLEQLVTQSLSNLVSGNQPQITAPPGVAPMMTPPPGAAPPSPATMGGMAAGAPSGPPGPMGR